MHTSRRGFLRWAAGGAALLLARPRAAAEAPAESALDIHRATRNTRLGAVGTRLRAARGALRPWKAYPGHARVALPTPDWDAGRALFALAQAWAPAPAFAGDPCTAADLSRLLALTNGITGQGPGPPLRAAPSAGALYAGEVYVVAERVEGVPPGAYYYGVGSHGLVRVREGRLLGEVAASLERPGEAAGAAAAVLLSNVFARYRVRYANRGYRYALIDSGHIGENLRWAAAELGLATRTPLRWEDDRLNPLLGLDGREEAVCAVHLVGKATERAGAPGEPARARRLVERRVAEPGAVSGALAETERYHEATKLVAGSGGERAAAEAERLAAGERGGKRAAGAGAGSDARASDDAGAAAPDTPVHRAIRVRRSARRFESAPMPRADLLRILALAQGLPALQHCEGIDLHAVVHRVAGLEAGLYRYAPAAGALEPRRPGALADALVAASLGQTKTGEAAAAVVAVARLAEATAREGARAYRHLLLEAGAIAQRLYLAAEAHGHAARNLAAYYDDELDALLGLDGAREVAVHLTAVGVGD